MSVSYGPVEGPTKFLESNALLYAQGAQWTEMHDVLDELSAPELLSLHRAANRLRLTIWDRLGRPRGPAWEGDRPVPDPRKHHTYDPLEVDTSD